MSSPSVVSRPILLCCGFSLTTPDAQQTECHACLLCGRHVLGAGDAVVMKEDEVPAHWSFPQVGGNEKLTPEQPSGMMSGDHFWGAELLYSKIHLKAILSP